MRPQIVCLAFVLLLWGIGAAAKDALEVRLSPNPVAAGETFTIDLTSSDGRRPRLLQMPPFAPRGESRSTRSDLSGTRTSVSYHFAAGEPGQYTIPPLPVKLGSETVRTPELALKVLKSEALEVSGAETIFWRAGFAGPERKTAYVGEEIPLVLRFYMPLDNTFQIQLSYPEIQIGKSVFRDYRAENPEKAQFARPDESRAEVHGKLFRCITFRTAFRPLAPGKLTVKAELRYVLRVPEGGRRRDDFFEFDDFFGTARYRSIPKTLRAELPELTVKPLPPVPAGTLFTGLVGDWRGKLSLSQDKAALQEPLTLALELSGTGSGETLQAPKLELPGMRVYPAEVVRKNGTIQLLYTVIPLHGTAIPVRADFAAFDPAAGEYRHWTIDRTLTVTPAAQPPSSAATVDFDRRKAAAAPEAGAAPRPHSTMLYCRTAPDAAVDGVWMRNQTHLLWLLGLAGPLFFVIHELVYRHRRRIQNDPDRQRRFRASGRHAELRRAVRTAPVSELPGLATGALASYLCDRWGLPPGAGSEQVAEAAHDPELAEAMHQCEECSYLPSETVRTMLEKDGETLRKALLRGLKLVLLALSLGAGFAAEAAKSPEHPATWQEALAAYDRGDYPQAESYFLDQLKTRGSDPNVLYNLGCIKAAENEPEQALWYLERAALRKPWASAFQENRNLLRRRFFLPEKDSGTTPREVLLAFRDRLRPDHYGVLAGLFWCVLWVILSFRRSLGATVNWSLRATCLAGMAAALLAAFAQMRTSYAPDQGFVTAKSVVLTSLPGEHNGKKLGTLAGGTPVKILEERRGWLHLAGRDQEGWVPAGAVGKLP